MAVAIGLSGQQRGTLLYDASGTISVGGQSQLALPVALSRCYLFIENLHNTSALRVEIGSARATAALTSGAVSSVTVTNGGFGFTYPPLIEFLGGGRMGTGALLGCGQPDYPSPGFSEGGGLPAISGDHPAKAHAVLTAGVVTSIVIDDPGQGYLQAPYVRMFNDPRDPFGVADPNYGSAVSGIVLNPAGSETFENNVCPTDAISVFGATTGQPFTIKYFT